MSEPVVRHNDVGAKHTVPPPIRVDDSVRFNVTEEVRQ